MLPSDISENKAETQADNTLGCRACITFNLYAETDGPYLALPQVILELPVTELSVSHLRVAVQHRHRNS